MNVWYPRGTPHEPVVCSHGFDYLRERKMQGTLWTPPTRECVECAHAVALADEASERDFDAFCERLKARKAEQG